MKIVLLTVLILSLGLSACAKPPATNTPNDPAAAAKPGPAAQGGLAPGTDQSSGRAQTVGAGDRLVATLEPEANGQENAIDSGSAVNANSKASSSVQSGVPTKYNRLRKNGKFVTAEALKKSQQGAEQ